MLSLPIAPGVVWSGFVTLPGVVVGVTSRFDRSLGCHRIQLVAPVPAAVGLGGSAPGIVDRGRSRGCVRYSRRPCTLAFAGRPDSGPVAGTGGRLSTRRGRWHGCRIVRGREDAPGSVTDGIRKRPGGRGGDASGRQAASSAGRGAATVAANSAATSAYPGGVLSRGRSPSRSRSARSSSSASGSGCGVNGSRLISADQASSAPMSYTALRARGPWSAPSRSASRRSPRWVRTRTVFGRLSMISAT